jgi:hypothetical protein
MVLWNFSCLAGILLCRIQRCTSKPSTVVTVVKNDIESVATSCFALYLET